MKPLPSKPSDVIFVQQSHGGNSTGLVVGFSFITCPTSLTYQWRKKVGEHDNATRYRGERDALKDKVKDLESKLNRQQQNYYELKEDLEQYQRTMEQAEIDWTTQNNGLKETIQDLSYQLHYEQQKVVSVKQSANQIQLAKDTNVIIFATQEMDAAIRQKIGALLQDIRTWSGKFSCDTGRMPDFKSTKFPEYRRVVPSCNSHADLVHFMNKYQNDKGLDEKRRDKMDKKFKRRFIRGWASFVMVESCFCPSDSWLRSADAQAFHHIERLLSGADPTRKGASDRAFHDWKALTAYLLSTVTPQATQGEDMGKVATDAAIDVINLLHPWAKSSLPESLEQQLVGIYQEALQLSRLLRTQRAHWELNFPTGDASALPYDMISMEDDDDEDIDVVSPNRMVEMVIEPALSKRGTMDGTKFEAGPHVTMKAKVCLES
ncbi:uncharacterized protein N0V89_007780 [Didymosphaeria variabile]|uniref:Uncharacterized protein n=1 Tax=Didymosphaeria variabile TaxID=1932322 RepID=A0A9W8XK55_9PLEO|nr:uncharacterized protein N0V89_007780 [Didymosphaeria variabile]KAJ4352432.1 hypothetical protein N0V89_007780 [Didymosphaeria variabile]